MANQHGEVAKENNCGGVVEVLLPEVGVTRAGKNPCLAIAASEA